jgi:hypothetical protein
MHTAFVECELVGTESVADVSTRLARLGIMLVPGHEPAMMRGSSGNAATVVFTVTVPDSIDDAQLSNIPGVVAVFGDPAIGRLDSD